MIKFSKLLVIVLLSIALSKSANALIDMKNGNYTFCLIMVPFDHGELRNCDHSLTYNSRNLFNGSFGFGWGSPFDNSLKQTGSGMLHTHGGGGLEVPFFPDQLDPKFIDAQNERILSIVKNKNSDLTEEYLEQLTADLKTRPFLRSELLRQLSPGGFAEYQSYRSTGGDTILKQATGYTLTYQNGTIYKFDLIGRMTYFKRKGGIQVNIERNEEGKILFFTTNGEKFSVEYEKENKIKKIQSTKNKESMSFSYSGDDLTTVSRNGKIEFVYRYDHEHNLIEAEISNGDVRKITYNTEKDWATSFTDYNGCIEVYDFTESKSDSENDYMSSITKTCGDKITNKSHYRFVHKYNKLQLRYLYNAESTINGHYSSIIYHPLNGKPIIVINGDQETYSTFSKRGNLHTKFSYNKSEVDAYEYIKITDSISCKGKPESILSKQSNSKFYSKYLIKYSHKCYPLEILKIGASEEKRILVSEIDDGFKLRLKSQSNQELDVRQLDNFYLVTCLASQNKYKMEFDQESKDYIVNDMESFSSFCADLIENDFPVFKEAGVNLPFMKRN